MSYYSEQKNAYSLLIVFLYQMLTDPNINKDQQTKVGELIVKLTPQKYLTKQDLMKEFILIIENFLGTPNKFKQHLQASVNQIQQKNFNLDHILCVASQFESVAI